MNEHDAVRPSVVSDLAETPSATATPTFPSDVRQAATSPAESPSAPAGSASLSTPNLVLQRYPLVLFLLAWIAGTALAQLNLLATSGWITVAVISISATLILRAKYRDWRLPISSTTAIAVVAAAAIYSQVFRPAADDSLSPLASRSSQPVALRGTISEAAVWSPNPYHRDSDPNSEPWSTRWLVQWDSLREGENWQPIECRSKLSTQGRITELLPGDRIEVFGSFESIAQPTNPGMRDYRRLAKTEGIFVAVHSDDSSQIRLIESTRQWPLQRLRGLAVRYVDDSLNRFVGLNQAPLAAALVFGQREQVDWESQQQLMTTGTLHMLAISGMHVEIIAATLLLLCQLLGLRRGTVAALVVTACAAYSGLAGSNPPVLRALIMIVAFTFARHFGLISRLSNLLALSAILLLLLNPSNLFNVGVQLSFLAVATIGIFNRSTVTARRNALQSLLEENLPRWQRLGLTVGRYFRSAIRISFWVWLFTTPLIWHHFHVVSFISIPLNALLSIPLMIGLLNGLITPLVSWIPWVGTIPGSISGWCLAMIDWCVEVANSIPLGHMWLPSPPLWWSVTFYAAGLLWLAVGRGKKQWGLAVVLVAWMVVGVSLFAFGPKGFLGSNSENTWTASAELKCTFVDVGHGTCVIIEMPDGRVWLYDAGHMGVSGRSHEVVASTLWSMQIARIDTLIISHADSDHYNATPGLLQRFHVGRIVSTKRFWESTAREVQRVHRAVLDSGNKKETWNTQTKIVDKQSDVAIEILHPSPTFRAETDNADSLCLQFEYGGSRLLLPGDVEGSGLLSLCDNPPRRCQLMMAPHHGSLSHDISELLRWCDPEIVVVSGNERAVRPEVLSRFLSAEQLGVTFADGAIQVRIDASGKTSAFRWNDDHWSPLPSQSAQELEGMKVTSN